ncbi:heterokaryon incompatibility protein-domain-containing protein, partial [Phaeosphaeria sp. MPI-PUGE-AT-0046c]
WLTECRQNHEKCISWKKKHHDRGPMRLLDLSTQNPKLIVPAKGQIIPYVALSHCWGGGSPLRTVQANVDQHFLAINENDLPKTFRDAIIVTKTLDFQYLWIDSLCIVQDDHEDWAREAAKMADIYESAELTIAATWARNGDAGCFREGFPPFSATIGMQSDPGGTLKDVVNISMRPEYDEFASLHRAPLNTRAWTLQERLLSLRIVSFAADQMHWACPSKYNSEDGLGLSEYIFDGRNTILSYETGNSSAHGDDDDEEDELRNYTHFRESWTTTVTSYSERHLTFAKDKLVALAGVTQAYERIFGDTAILGLWRQELARGLTWTVAKHSTLDDEAIRTLNLPSWTWLKMRGHVEYIKQIGAESLLDVLDVDVQWSGRPMISTITTAAITLRGKLAPILSWNSQLAPEPCVCVPGRVQISIDVNGSRADVDLYTLNMDVCAPTFPPESFCLLVYDDEIIGRWGRRNADLMQLSALLLVPAKGGSAVSSFQRIGVMLFQEFPSQVFEDVREQTITLV